MLIIPAIDILGSKIVRLSRGDFGKVKEYELTPLEQAGIFYENGLSSLHIVDLSGSKDGKMSVLKIISSIKEKYDVKIQSGGGIRNFEDAANAFSAGIDKLVIGSLSVINKPEFEKIASFSGKEKIIIAADSLRGKIMIKGWKENSEVSIYEHINYCVSLGLDGFLCTDIHRDGVLGGPSFELYAQIQEWFPSVNLIASGGIGGIEDIKKLRKMDLYAAVVGKAIYENKIELKELKKIAD